AGARAPGGQREIGAGRALSARAPGDRLAVGGQAPGAHHRLRRARVHGRRRALGAAVGASPAGARLPLRRSWLFVPGADPAAHEAAAKSGADVIILELEDFTPPELRPKARALSRDVFDRWRQAGARAAARINPLETCGNEDLIGVLAGRPDLILMSKVAT